jgi:hypothetical protein
VFQVEPGSSGPGRGRARSPLRGRSPFASSGPRLARGFPSAQRSYTQERYSSELAMVSGRIRGSPVVLKCVEIAGSHARRPEDGGRARGRPARNTGCRPRRPLGGVNLDTSENRPKNRARRKMNTPPRSRRELSPSLPSWKKGGHSFLAISTRVRNELRHARVTLDASSGAARGSCQPWIRRHRKSNRSIEE